MNMQASLKFFLLFKLLLRSNTEAKEDFQCSIYLHIVKGVIFWENLQYLVTLYAYNHKKYPHTYDYGKIQNSRVVKNKNKYR